MSMLKPYTRYTCPACDKCSRWTGAYSAPRPTDSVCLVCGAELVEEVPDGRWRVAFESVSAVRYPELYGRNERVRPDVDREALGDEYWSPHSRETDSEHSARQQHDGLLSLIAEGELIRNVRCQHSEVAWSEVVPTRAAEAADVADPALPSSSAGL